MAQKWDGATPLFCRVKNKEESGSKVEPVTVKAEEVERMRAQIIMAQCSTTESIKPAKQASKAPDSTRCSPGGNVIGRHYGRIRTVAPRC
jgi:hypothetical protein